MKYEKTLQQRLTEAEKATLNQTLHTLMLGYSQISVLMVIMTGGDLAACKAAQMRIEQAIETIINHFRAELGGTADADT